MKSKNKCRKGFAVAFVAVLLTLTAIVLSGCQSVKRLEAQKVELTRGVEIKQDSIGHRWVVNRVTLYDGGEVKRVEEVEQHAKEVVTKLLRDTVYISQIDTLYIHKDAEPVVKVVRDTKLIVFAIASFLVLGLLLIDKFLRGNIR